MVIRKTKNDWSAEDVVRFWDWFNKNDNNENIHFTKQYGRGISKLINFKLLSSGRLLDYGCGNGYLIKHLLNNGLECHAVELSKNAIDIVNKKYEGRKGWMGGKCISQLPTPYPDDYFDAIACIETFEHLNDTIIKEICQEFHRILKPGGTVLVTTPYSENFEPSMIYCPFCDSEFHRVQHLQSFNEDKLREILESNGLRVTYTNHTNLFRFHSPFCLDYTKVPKNRNLLTLSKWFCVNTYDNFCYTKERMLDIIMPREFPHQRELTRKCGSGLHLFAFAEKVNREVRSN
jgi:SAM-dependent methyltransferase